MVFSYYIEKGKCIEKLNKVKRRLGATRANGALNSRARSSLRVDDRYQACGAWQRGQATVVETGARNM
jgi:hypothetical protein